MATLVERYNDALDSALRIRVKMALIKAALDIAAEAATSDTALDARRKALASLILRAPSAWTAVMVFGVVENANVGLGGTDDPLTDDGTLDYVVASIWNAYALAEVPSA